MRTKLILIIFSFLTITVCILLVYEYFKYDFQYKVLQHLQNEGFKKKDIKSINTKFNKLGYWTGVVFNDEKNVIYIYEKNKKTKEIEQTTYDSTKREGDLKHLQLEE